MVVVEISVHVVAAVIGVWIVVSVLLSAIRTVVVPRGERLALTAFVFLGLRRVLRPVLDRAGEARRERILQRYAPVALLLLALSWALLVIAGFAWLFWSIGGLSWDEALVLSGSSLTTLGFATSDTPHMMAAVLEAIIGLGLVGLLISFLPAMYGSYSRRELLVAQLASRAGQPPTAAEFITRLHRIRGLDDLDDLWGEWEMWFAELEETHTSYPALVYFRSGIGRSWLTAAGALLDAAAFITAAVDTPRRPAAPLCIRAGFLSLREIAAFFDLPFDRDPAAAAPISVTRQEWDETWERLAAVGVPLRADRDQAWRDWAGWRVNYDQVLLALCGVVQPPAAPWSSDRGVAFHRPVLRTIWRYRRHAIP